MIKKYFIYGMMIGFILFMVQYHFPREVEYHPFFDESLNKIVPHRGGKGIFPENTLFAFEQSKKLGYNVLELDVRSTKDSVLVVFHDSTLMRMTGQSGQISQLNYDQIQSIFLKTEHFDNQIIPTVEGLFNQIKDVKFIIEIKGRENFIPEKLCRLIKSYQLENNVLTASFTSGQTERFRQECPAVATGATIDEMKKYGLLNKIFLDGIIFPDYEAMILPLNWKSNRLVTQKLVKRTKEKNINLYVWTINDTNIISELIKFGVDGIISDLHTLHIHD